METERVNDQEIVNENFSQTGGVRIGLNRWLAINLTWPFASIDVSAERLIVEYLGTMRRFEKQSIKLEEYFGMFSRGVRIIHSDSLHPKWVVFWSYKTDELMSALERFGYDVGRVVPDEESHGN